LGLTSLPIEQYPDIAPPTIQVSTTYTGANAQSVLNSVIAPIEEQINGAENMDYMLSSASNNGSATITVYFKQGMDPDMAAVDVQNRVAKASAFLPSEVNQVGVTTQKRQSSMLMVLTLYATSMTRNGVPIADTDQFIIATNKLDTSTNSLITEINAQKVYGAASLRWRTVVKDYLEALSLNSTLGDVADNNWHVTTAKNSTQVVKSALTSENSCC